jgi:hypothetical protein
MSSPRTDAIDGLQFDDPISPVDESHFDDSSLITDESEDSALSRRVTDDNPRDDETSIYQDDWMRFGGAVAMFPPGGRNSLDRVQEFDEIQFQGGTSPLHCEECFFTPGNSMCSRIRINLANLAIL